MAGWQLPGGRRLGPLVSPFLNRFGHPAECLALGGQGILDYHGPAGKDLVFYDALVLSRFPSAAQVWADEYADYKYNHTDWRAIRP